MPDEVRRQFVQSGNVYYFPDGARAFVDRGERLTTRSENTEVIRSLVAIAQARGWQDVTVNGTQRFRRDTWFAARLAGLEVRGHTPTAIDEGRLVRALARTAAAPAAGTALPPNQPGAECALPRAHRAPSTDGTARTAGAPDEDRTGQRRSGVAPPGQREHPWVGRLIDHGPAPYQHHPSGSPSYFVRLEARGGEREIWGVDLQRAYKESLTQPQIGDEVVLRTVRQEPVTVRAREFDEAGRFVSEKPLATHRNRWVFEKREFLRERAQAARTLRDPRIDAKRGAARHPELAGTYVSLRAAEELLDNRQTQAENKRRLMALIREVLAKSVARGDPLEPVRLRGRPAARAAPRQERARTPEPSAVR